MDTFRALNRVSLGCEYLILRTDPGCLPDINATDDQGATALHYAAHRGEKTIVQALLAHGADVNSGDDEGAMPLHVAAFKGFEPIARLLLETLAHSAKGEATSPKISVS